MSFYDDYVAEGLCCEVCGALIDADEPGFARRCAGCADRPEKPRKRKGKNHGQKR